MKGFYKLTVTNPDGEEILEIPIDPQDIAEFEDGCLEATTMSPLKSLMKSIRRELVEVINEDLAKSGR